MAPERHPLTARFETAEYQALERARRRFRCRSLSEFIHDAAIHYAGHNRSIGSKRRGGTDRLDGGPGSHSAESEC